MINELTARLDPRQLEIWLQSLALAKACKFEEGPSYQVIPLALRLFDELAVLYQYGETKRFQLQLPGSIQRRSASISCAAPRPLTSSAMVRRRAV